jgi:hypothetical protein
MSAAQTCFVVFIGALLDWIVAYNKNEHGIMRESVPAAPR